MCIIKSQRCRSSVQQIDSDLTWTGSLLLLSCASPCWSAGWCELVCAAVYCAGSGRKDRSPAGWWGRNEWINKLQRHIEVHYSLYEHISMKTTASLMFFGHPIEPKWKVPNPESSRLNYCMFCSCQIMLLLSCQANCKYVSNRLHRNKISYLHVSLEIHNEK